jgi:tetratricopeptide (TPR) repeat protein
MTPPTSPVPLSPRRQRLRWTLATLVTLAALGLLSGWIVYQRSRPEPYQPDEASEDITRSLARNLPPEAPTPRLVEVTRDAGLSGYRNFAGNRTSQLPEDMGPGLAWGDFDNDGDDDLFLVGAGGGMDVPDEHLPACALYENQGDGMFRQVAGFPDTRIRGLGAAWADYDGDGFLDLAVAGYNALRLFRNEGGSGRFTRDSRLPEPGGFWTSVAWGDYDNDRRLDLYVANYVRFDPSAGDRERERLSDQVGTAVPYTLNPASYEPGHNALFHQHADGTFLDVARELGVHNPTGRSLGGVWHDFDQDGWLDLYVANDVSDNAYYRNRGGRFEDISHPAWVADYRSAMGLAIGDFDRDGDDDLHITHWVAQENALYENMWADLSGWRTRTTPVGSTGITPRQATAVTPTSQPSTSTDSEASPGAGKSVALRFVDIADQKGLGQIALSFVGWGTEFVDLDQDGWLDLLAVNGSTLESGGQKPRKLQAQESFLFWNRRGEYFYNLAPLHSGLSEKHVSRGLALSDFDNDGDMDFAIADLGEGVRLYRNDMASGHWLQLRLRSRHPDERGFGSGDGSTAVAWVNGVPLRRSVTGISYLSSANHTLHWGLGGNARLDRLEVRWHAGSTGVVENLAADARYVWTEGEAAPRRWMRSNTAEDRLPAATPSEDPGGRPVSGGDTLTDRQRTLEFWNLQRAAMSAMKIERNNRKAIGWFRDALALNPGHEDSRYYLGHCLASEGDTEGALIQLAELQRINPSSHRAWQQWGILRATFSRGPADLAAAETALERAHRLNPEETGALLALGEVALLRGDAKSADDRLAAATRTNPKAAGGFFLRGYLAWKRGDAVGARAFLGQTRQSFGKDWQPKGATSEGDVQRKQHVEVTPLTRFWEAWNGVIDPEISYAPIDRSLSGVRESTEKDH